MKKVFLIDKKGDKYTLETTEFGYTIKAKSTKGTDIMLNSDDVAEIRYNLAKNEYHKTKTYGTIVILHKKKRFVFWICDSINAKEMEIIFSRPKLHCPNYLVIIAYCICIICCSITIISSTTISLVLTTFMPIVTCIIYIKNKNEEVFDLEQGDLTFFYLFPTLILGLNVINLNLCDYKWVPYAIFISAFLIGIQFLFLYKNENTSFDLKKYFLVVLTTLIYIPAVILNYNIAYPLHKTTEVVKIINIDDFSGTYSRHFYSLVIQKENGEIIELNCNRKDFIYTHVSDKTDRTPPTAPSVFPDAHISPFYCVPLHTLPQSQAALFRYFGVSDQLSQRACAGGFRMYREWNCILHCRSLCRVHPQRSRIDHLWQSSASQYPADLRSAQALCQERFWLRGS